MTSINNSAMTQTSAPVGAGTIPDLVKIGTIPTDTAIDVATEILEPVSFSQSECRFILSNKGILHSNSRITLGVDKSVFTAPTQGQNGFLPINVGVGALLQRVRLTVGGKTISEIEDFNHYQAYESNFITPEQLKEREQVFSSRTGLAMSATLKERQAEYEDAGTAANNIESISEADSICIDNGNDFDYDNTRVGRQVLPKGTDPGASRAVMGWCDTFNEGVFSILLADLFPFLKMNQLPLFMLKEQVAIHLTFTPQVGAPSAGADSSRIVTTLGDVADADATIIRDSVKMVADYIFYPQEMMLQYQQANANMSFSYVDYQFVKRTVSSAEFAGQLIQNVGGAGRIVNKVCVQVENKTPFDQGPINNYGSDTPLVTAAGNGTITTNLRYNDLFLFPIDVSNSARQFHNILMTEGRMPHINRDVYSGQGQLAKEVQFGAFEDYPMGSAAAGGSALNVDLRSRGNWHCYRLNRNERVNSRGIELYDQRTTMSGASTLRAWVQVVRMAQLNEGRMEVVYA